MCLGFLNIICLLIILWKISIFFFFVINFVIVFILQIVVVIQNLVRKLNKKKLKKKVADKVQSLFSTTFLLATWKLLKSHNNVVVYCFCVLFVLVLVWVWAEWYEKRGFSGFYGFHFNVNAIAMQTYSQFNIELKFCFNYELPKCHNKENILLFSILTTSSNLLVIIL